MWCRCRRRNPSSYGSISLSGAGYAMNLLMGLRLNALNRIWNSASSRRAASCLANRAQKLPLFCRSNQSLSELMARASSTRYNVLMMLWHDLTRSVIWWILSCHGVFLTQKNVTSFPFQKEKKYQRRKEGDEKKNVHFSSAQISAGSWCSAVPQLSPAIASCWRRWISTVHFCVCFSPLHATLSPANNMEQIARH